MLVAAFGLFAWEMAAGATLAEARTAAVNVFVVIELCYLFNCRSLRQSVLHLGLFTNPWVIAGAATMLLLQVGYTYLPFMNHLFQSAPLSLAVWGRIALAGAAVFLTIEIEKKLSPTGRDSAIPPKGVKPNWRR